MASNWQGYSPKFPVGNPTWLLQKQAMESFHLSHEDAADKNDRKLRIKGQLINWPLKRYVSRGSWNNSYHQEYTIIACIEFKTGVKLFTYSKYLSQTLGFHSYMYYVE